CREAEKLRQAAVVMHQIGAGIPDREALADNVQRAEQQILVGGRGRRSRTEAVSARRHRQDRQLARGLVKASPSSRLLTPFGMQRTRISAALPASTRFL